MNVFRQLAGQTAIYGLSSIVGRLFYFFLVPLYTRIFDPVEYGVVTQLYANIAFFGILFTYGLETAFFRFFQTQNGNPGVYSTSLLSIVGSSVFFGLLIFIFSDPITTGIFELPLHNSIYVKMFAGILVFDAITAIPFAKLRQLNKAKRFAFIRLTNIGVNIGLNLFFLVLCPALIKDGSTGWISSIYDPTFGVGYVFLSNLIASGVAALMLAPEMFNIKKTFDTHLWKQMIVYAFPLMIAGFAGVINETFDRILLPILIEDKTDALVQVGIYGACYKLSIIMTLFIQTFRYAAEPFFFNHSTKENPQPVYAHVMNYFVIVCSFIFLCVMFYIDIVKYFIGEDFRSGLAVVPILLMANLCLGVYYNLSVWYKLTSRTRWGAWLSIIGAIITLVFNFLLIPVMGYMGAAWTTLICYSSMMIISYYVGQKYYPVPYSLKSFFYYIGLVLIFWRVSELVRGKFMLSEMTAIIFNSSLLILFLALVFMTERRKNNYLRGSSG